MFDHYKTLGVSRTASDEDIKQAYRKLARQYHPDINKTAEAGVKMREINTAYEVLSDPNERAYYDRKGAMSSSQGSASTYQGSRSGSASVSSSVTNVTLGKKEQVTIRVTLRGVSVRQIDTYLNDVISCKLVEGPRETQVEVVVKGSNLPWGKSTHLVVLVGDGEVFKLYFNVQTISFSSGPVEKEGYPALVKQVSHALMTEAVKPSLLILVSFVLWFFLGFSELVTWSTVSLEATHRIGLLYGFLGWMYPFLLGVQVLISIIHIYLDVRLMIRQNPQISKKS